MPVVEPPAAAAVHAPSHLPLQSTFTPPLALQLPVQLAEQLPVHSSVAVPIAVQSPLQSTLNVPPMHLGGLAFTSHIAEASQLASQLAVACTEAVQTGGV